MRAQIQALLRDAVARMIAAGELPEDLEIDIQISRTRDPAHGDFACNLPLALAKPARQAPRKLAQALVAHLPPSSLLSKVEIAGPGFINFHLSDLTQFEVVGRVLEQGAAFGHSTLGQGRQIQIEFVSANPTGPLHVGHGRGAAYGATVANLLAAVGFDVQREYYVNDAGRQMNILAASVWLRYLELCGESLSFPQNAYKGDYVWDIAATLHREHGQSYFAAATDVFADLPADANAGGDKELYIDAVIERARSLLGDNRWRFVFELGLNAILDDIRADLEQFGVSYDAWFSERSLSENGAVNRAIEGLRENNWLYEKDGAWWFRSTDFGDEKDRVVIRENGQTTYFASDIAYHMDKMERGYERVIDVWGADHHGYVPRVKAALQALGYDAGRLDVLLVQFAILYRGGEKQQMSTRSGEFVTLRELRREVGNDAARFFYVMRRCEQHMDFDLDLARSQSNENPVFYVQYAHARICSVYRQADERGIRPDPGRGLANLQRLIESHETDLLTQLGKFPEIVEASALNEEPHQLVHYLRELANGLHTYYNTHQFLVDDAELRDARLCLVAATRQTLANGLDLLGVSAPESM